MVSKGNILVIDDTESILVILTELLKENGYYVSSANSGKKAFEILENYIPDLILLDVMMPEMTGLEVFKKMKNYEKYENIPVIFLSAATEKKNRIEGLRLGAVDYITKPFEQEELIARVKTHIDFSKLNNTLKLQSEQIKNYNDQLVNFNRNLEEKVQQRTIELQVKNKEYIKLNEELKFAIEKIEESEKKFLSAYQYAKGLLEASLDPLVTINENGKIMNVNRATEEVTGLSRFNLIGTDFSDYFTEPDVARKGYLKAFDIGYIIDYPLTIRHASNRLIDVLYNATVYRNEQGKIIGVFAAARDITERKIADEALKESELKFKTFADFTHDWEFWLSPENEYIYNSPSCERITGYKPHAFEKNPDLLEQIIHKEDISRYVNHKEFVMKNHISEEIDFRITKKNGEICWINHVCKTVYNENGQNIGIRGSNRDITIRKNDETKIQQLNKKLIEINEDKDRFISIIAHDLKSPFNSILGFLNLLSKNIHKYDIDKIENQINIINISAKKTFNLLEDILMWASAQSGKLPFNPENLNLYEVCNELLQILNPIAQFKNVNISCVIPQHVYVRADKNMINTVLRNLISNAIKFTNENGNINIFTENSNSFIIINVIDNGIGIEPEMLNKLFDNSHFKTKDGTYGEKGTGFGLHLCKEFIEKHGGKIWVESKVNIGSNFKFTLPLF